MDTDFFLSYNEIKNSEIQRNEIQRIPEMGNIEDIPFFKEQLISSLITKKQEKIYSESDFYVARDVLTNTRYICFKDFLTIDIDNHKKECDSGLETLYEFCSENPDYLFAVYQSSNGFHIFCLSHKKYYKDNIDFQLKLKSDYFYAIFSNIRGYSIRLNRKMADYMSYMRHKDTTPSIYKFIQNIGTGQGDPRLLELMKIHDLYVKKFENSTPSKQP